MKKTKKQTKGLISKRLGVDMPPPLTRAKCIQKVRILRYGIEHNKYRGELRRYAVYYANWYRWKSERIKRLA